MRELLENSEIRSFSLTEENISVLNERTLIVKKWNWDYDLSHKFQRHALKLVQDTPHLRILIFTNHPNVLTNGRGLQKPRKGENLTLVDFQRENFSQLPYPIFQIERGGGLTFHHPGQFIFYPIVKLNPKSLSLSPMMDHIFDFSIEILNDWGVTNLSHAHELLGLWHGNKKLASMGIAIEKLTTFHGMALNIKYHPEMALALKDLNPCGLNPNTYISVEELISLPQNPLEAFQQDFLQKIAKHWN